MSQFTAVQPLQDSNLRYAFNLSLDKLLVQQTQSIGLQQIHALIDEHKDPQTLSIILTSMSTCKWDIRDVSGQDYFLKVSYERLIVQQQQSERAHVVNRLFSLIKRCMVTEKNTVQSLCAETIARLLGLLSDSEGYELVLVPLMEMVYNIADRAYHRTAALSVQYVIRNRQMTRQTLQRTLGQIVDVYLKLAQLSKEICLCVQTSVQLSDFDNNTLIKIIRKGLAECQKHHSHVKQQYQLRVAVCEVIREIALKTNSDDHDKIASVFNFVVQLTDLTTDRVVHVQIAARGALDAWNVQSKGQSPKKQVHRRTSKLESGTSQNSQGVKLIGTKQRTRQGNSVNRHQYVVKGGGTGGGFFNKSPLSHVYKDRGRDFQTSRKQTFRELKQHTRPMFANMGEQNVIVQFGGKKQVVPSPEPVTEPSAKTQNRNQEQISHNVPSQSITKLSLQARQPESSDDSLQFQQEETGGDQAMAPQRIQPKNTDGLVHDQEFSNGQDIVQLLHPQHKDDTRPDVSVLKASFPDLSEQSCIKKTTSQQYINYGDDIQSRNPSIQHPTMTELQQSGKVSAVDDSGHCEQSEFQVRLAPQKESQNQPWSQEIDTDFWGTAIRLMEEGQTDQAFTLVIQQDDFLWFLRMVLLTKNEQHLLSVSNLQAMWSKLIDIHHSSLLDLLFLGIFKQAHELDLIPSFTVSQLSEYRSVLQGLCHHQDPVIQKTSQMLSKLTRK